MPDATHVHDVLRGAGADVASVEVIEHLGPVVRCSCEQAPTVLSALNASHPFLADLFGVDTGEAVDVVYHLRSFERDEDVRVYVTHPYGGTLVSVWERYPSALMPERECAEMLDLKLSGHPNPKHLLLTSASEPMLLKRVAIRTAEEVRDR